MQIKRSKNGDYLISEKYFEYSHITCPTCKDRNAECVSEINKDDFGEYHEYSCTNQDCLKSFLVYKEVNYKG